MYVTDPCVSCGMRQRIPTLNLNLILNPKLDLISKLITVALLPTRPRDPIYTHSHSRISTLSHTHTLLCRPIVRCWEGHLGPSQSKRARVHVSHALPSPPYPPPTNRTHANGPPPPVPRPASAPLYRYPSWRVVERDGETERERGRKGGRDRTRDAQAIKRERRQEGKEDTRKHAARAR